MTAVVVTFLACWLVLAMAPHTTIGRVLHRLLVERPASRLSRLSRGDAATGLLLLSAIGMIAFVGEGDAIRMLMFAAPDVALWITTFEVTAYIDVVMALVLAASNLRIRASIGQVLAGVLRNGKPRNTDRDRRSRGAGGRAASNDDDDGRDGLRLAA